MDKNITNFLRITKALSFIDKNRGNQPSLSDIAEHINLSPFHFQKLFQDWAGVSPAKFLQFLNISYAKSILAKQTLSSVSFETGLSSTGRLHDLFIKIEGMTPGEYKNKGENLNLEYFVSPCRYGFATIANSSKGICYVGFHDDRNSGLEELKAVFENAHIINQTSDFQQLVIDFIENNQAKAPLPLHLKGTDFQIKVWEALLTIPSGKFTSYSELAKKTGNGKASRAVGSAIGKNPIAFLIPCHRVIQSTGEFGQYRWNKIRKQIILCDEAVQL